mgnify:CR=1 FL=1
MADPDGRRRAHAGAAEEGQVQSSRSGTRERSRIHPPAPPPLLVAPSPPLAWMVPVPVIVSASIQMLPAEPPPPLPDKHSDSKPSE